MARDAADRPPRESCRVRPPRQVHANPPGRSSCRTEALWFGCPVVNAQHSTRPMQWLMLRRRHLTDSFDAQLATIPKKNAIESVGSSRVQFAKNHTTAHATHSTYSRDRHATSRSVAFARRCFDYGTALSVLARLIAYGETLPRPPGRQHFMNRNKGGTGCTTVTGSRISRSL